MKHCVNPACNAELEDYEMRCPVCGVSQKRREASSAQSTSTGTSANSSSSDSDNLVVERHWFVTFWLCLTAVTNLIVALVAFWPNGLYGDGDTVMRAFGICNGIISLVNLYAVWLLFNWKKVGFYIIVITTIVGSLISMFVMKSIPYGILSIIVLWLILQIPKNDIPCWKGMQ